ncbi:MAG: malectin domain-containing carbohydrate-binding protein [Pseudomonadota bacterium]
MTWNKLYCLPLVGILCSSLYAAEINFGSSGLKNENINNPTSLDFGPDGRLYVSQQDGKLLGFTITRDSAPQGSGSYTVTNTETINLVQQNIPNHTDDGTQTNVQKRQVTGILAAGTAAAPVLYVSSSDNLIGGGGGVNDKNLDTNSGVLSKLTLTSSGWKKVDLLRGLPRCEENHSTNGMDIFEKNGNTYLLLQQGGHTNKGAPSNNFVGTAEYLLSGALLVVNLTQLESMPVFTDPRTNTEYVYDLPTLNDPQRADITNSDPEFPYPQNHPLYQSTIDIGDPFGGNDGLNQSFAEPGGPVQIFAAGFRNAYDVVVTQSGKIYTSDNGPNTGWGGLPTIYNASNTFKGDESTTSYQPQNGDYIKNEFNESGSQGHGDSFHYIGTIDDAPGTYNGGHPNPIAAFPSRADLITYKKQNGSWQETSRYSLQQLLQGASGYFNGSLSISDFPDDPRRGKYLANAINSNEVNILDIINSSTNGITEYTASNFEGELQGNILTASFNGNINRYALNNAGTDITLKEVIFSGFGATPLDIIALPDNHPFAGTVWAATYGADNITIFEPLESSSACPVPGSSSFSPNGDFDDDGYSNQDEVDNGTNHCSGGSVPKDNDNDKVSDLNDNDDDNDGINDNNDVFAIDEHNGTQTQLPINYSFFNNDPGTGFFGLGFTGLMLDPSGNTNYLTQFDEQNMSFGGAAGKASIDLIPKGDPIGSLNTQEYAFQFGIDVDNQSAPFTIHSRLESPFFGINGNSTDPVPFQSAGIFIGNGDQNNYLKLVIGHGKSSTDNIDGVEVLLEVDGVKNGQSARFNVPGLLDGNAVDLFISIDPAQSTAQLFVSTGSGTAISPIGQSIDLPNKFFDPADNQGLAVGIIATSYGASADAFSAIWDFINISEDDSGTLKAIGEGDNGIDFGNLSAGAPSALFNLEITNLSGPSDPNIVIDNVSIVGSNSGLFSTSFTAPQSLGASEVLILPVLFTPNNSLGAKSATLQIAHSGNNSPLEIPLSANITGSSNAAVMRINAGGALVQAADGGPNWVANQTANSYNGDGYSVNTGNLASLNLNFSNKDASIPSYIDNATFNAIFKNERWDPPSGQEMQFDIPLSNGNYTVNLYMGSGFAGTQLIGDRVFSVSIENQLQQSDIDLIALFGHQSGGMLSFPVTVSDNELNIQFIHQIENPLINAIEILQ